MNGFIAAIMGLMAAVSGNSERQSLELTLATACQPVRWTHGPVLEEGHFKGTATLDCAYSGRGGGGFAQLEAYLVQRMLGKARQVHAGPIYGQQEGMPSTGYDFTIEFPFQGEAALVRQDGYVATDERTRLTSSMISKSIQATGNARYLKKFDVRFVIDPSAEPGNYRASIAASVQIQKPGLIPAGTFKTEVQKGIEKAVGDYRETVLKEIADNT